MGRPSRHRSLRCSARVDTTIVVTAPHPMKFLSLRASSCVCCCRAHAQVTQPTPPPPPAWRSAEATDADICAWLLRNMTRPPPWLRVGTNRIAGNRSLCPAGSQPSNTTGGCELCPPGRHQPVATIGYGDERCLECSAGRSTRGASGAILCDTCLLSEYADLQGASECTACSDNTSTCMLSLDQQGHPLETCVVGASATSQCACLPGYLHNGTACVACPHGASCCMCRETAGCYDEKFGRCDQALLVANFKAYGKPCKKCFSGSTVPIPMAGFQVMWRDRNSSARSHVTTNKSYGSSPVLMKCEVSSGMKTYDSIESPCLEGMPVGNYSCKEGHRGRLCVECEEGYSVGIQGPTKCLPCDSQRSRTVIVTAVLIFLFVVVPPGVGIMYWVVADKDSTQWLVYFRILVDHFQLLTINVNIMTNWPWQLIGIYQAASAATLNLNFM